MSSEDLVVVELQGTDDEGALDTSNASFGGSISRLHEAVSSVAFRQLVRLQ